MHTLKLKWAMSIIAIAGLIGIVATGCAATSNNPPETVSSAAATERATEVLDDIVSGRYADVHAAFDETLRENISPTDVKRTWEQFQSMRGSYRSHGDAIALGDGYIEVPLKMEEGRAVFRAKIDGNGNVAGFRVEEK